MQLDRPRVRQAGPLLAGAGGSRIGPVGWRTGGQGRLFSFRRAMRLTDILKPQNIKLPLVSKTKTEAIEELINLLTVNGELRDRERVLQAVLDRESTRSTGIGEGLAIPHGKTDGVSDLVMAIGRAAEPIDFGSVDGKPVTLIWLLTSPTDKTGPHITALGRVSKIWLMASPQVRKKLLGARNARDLYEVIVQQDELI